MSLRALLTILAIACSGLAAGAAPAHVNVNTADAHTIARVLAGVGLKKAQAIVRYRENHGRFDAPADLAKVKGIGPATISKNADRIVIGEAKEGAQPAAERVETSAEDDD